MFDTKEIALWINALIGSSVSMQIIKLYIEILPGSYEELNYERKLYQPPLQIYLV